MKISEILSQPEGKTLEFKRDLSSPRNILKTLIAFSNTAGGVVLIGVEDVTRNLLGLENALDEEERLCGLIGRHHRTGGDDSGGKKRRGELHSPAFGWHDRRL